LKIGIVQMARGPDLAACRDRIIEGISAAAELGARVAVIPEGAMVLPRGFAGLPFGGCDSMN
jgi:hypothetical protein